MEISSDTRRIVERLAEVIEDSDRPRRQIEQQLEMSSGYLTRLLTGRSELKYRQLLEILDCVEEDYGEFFASVFATPAARARAQALEAALRPPRAGVDVYLAGIHSVQRLRRRLLRVENELARRPASVKNSS